MPLLNKRTREEIRSGYTPASKKVRKKKVKFYTMFDDIGYKEDQLHCLFREIPSQIEDASSLFGKIIVSFLNSCGGICAFGVKHTGVVYGDRISRHEEDVLRCTIDESIKRITPCVRCDQYLVKFTPVVGKRFSESENSEKKQVLEIKVNQGDPYKLYEDQNHRVFVRQGCMVRGPLIPHEIRDITVKQLMEREKTYPTGKENPTIPPPKKQKDETDSKVKLGDGHKELVRRALLKPHGVPGGRKESAIYISSGESDQEAPLPLFQEKGIPATATSTMVPTSKDVKGHINRVAKQPTVLMETAKAIKGLLNILNKEKKKPDSSRDNQIQVNKRSVEIKSDSKQALTSQVAKTSAVTQSDSKQVLKSQVTKTSAVTQSDSKQVLKSQVTKTSAVTQSDSKQVLRSQVTKTFAVTQSDSKQVLRSQVTKTSAVTQSDSKQVLRSQVAKTSAVTQSDSKQVLKSQVAKTKTDASQISKSRVIQRVVRIQPNYSSSHQPLPPHPHQPLHSHQPPHPHQPLHSHQPPHPHHPHFNHPYINYHPPPARYSGSYHSGSYYSGSYPLPYSRPNHNW